MKNTFKTMICACIALTMLLSFASCSGAYMYDGMKGGYNNSPGGYNNSPAEYDRDGIHESPASPSGDDDDDDDGGIYNSDELIENDFIKTAENAVSTFSADVDTASYTIFRRLAGSGYTLGQIKNMIGGSVRIEEMVNYFDYSYDLPGENELFGRSVQIAKCPWNEETALMILGLQTKAVQSYSKNNLVFLIDVSGSMYSEDKLPLLKKAFNYLTDHLGKDDTVSIVTYSSGEEIVLDGCAGDKKQDILKAVNSLEANGSTNGEAGMKMAYQLAEKHFIPGGNNRILMATDGDLNVGISSREELIDFITTKRDAGTFLSVLGFGTGNYRDAAMEGLADNGNGVYYYIDSELEAEKVMSKDLFATLYTVAKDTKLQLTFDPAAVEEYRLIGYENRVMSAEDFENDFKDAGELGAGHSVTVCYELKLTENALENDNWMKLAVRYKAPDGDKSELEEYDIGKEAYTGTTSDDFRFAAAVIETGMILRNSKYLGGASIGSVKQLLDSCDLANDIYKAQFKELITGMASKEQ